MENILKKSIIIHYFLIKIPLLANQIREGTKKQGKIFPLPSFEPNTANSQTKEKLYNYLSFPLLPLHSPSKYTAKGKKKIEMTGRYAYRDWRYVSLGTHVNLN